MNTITKRLEINLYSPTSYEVIKAQQGDNLSRIIEFALYDQGEPYVVPDNVTIYMEGHRGDHSSFAPKDCTVSDNIVTAVLDSDILSEAGTAEAKIVMHDSSNGTILSTIPFKIHVQKSPCDKHKIEGEKKSLIDGLIDKFDIMKVDLMGHLEDNVRHITSNERTLWNTVSQKVDKVDGKGLSTNDYTDEEKDKVANISGTSVTGVKGDAESAYRNGNVNLTAANLGAVSKLGDTINGSLGVSQGCYNHLFYNHTNNSSFYRICTFKVTNVYGIDFPIEFDIVCLNTAIHVHIEFGAISGATDMSLKKFKYTYQSSLDDIGLLVPRMHKSSEGLWDLYIWERGWTDSAVCNLKISNQTKQSLNNGNGIMWDNTPVSTLLTDTITAELAEYNGNAKSATKALQDGNGNVIKDTYAKKSDLTKENVTELLGWNAHKSIGYSGVSTDVLHIVNDRADSGEICEDFKNESYPILVSGEGLKLTNVSSNIPRHVFGKYNKIQSSPYDYDFFTVGNGTSNSSRSNALRLTNGGNLYYNKGCAAGADYAEFFEWSDGNPSNEDRCGLFVTFDFDKDYDFSSYQEIPKIRPAQPGEFILGVISGNPAIVGNADEEWKGRYVRDEFDRITYNQTVEQVIELEEVETGNFRTEIGYDEDDNEIEIQVPVTEIREIETGEYVTTDKWKVQNPDYDPEKEYESRFDRQEWDTACMLGVISVRDDGSCVSGKYCKCGADGIATLADERGFDTYFVVRRLTDNVVKILFR